MRLETEEARGVYAGAIGYLSATGDMDFAVPSELLILKDQTMCDSRAGIVYDSIMWQAQKPTNKG